MLECDKVDSATRIRIVIRDCYSPNSPSIARNHLNPFPLHPVTHNCRSRVACSREHHIESLAAAPSSMPVYQNPHS